MVEIGKLTKRESEILRDNLDSQVELFRLHALDAVLKHHGSQVLIYVQTKDITRTNPFRYEFVEAKAVLINAKDDFNKIEIDCLVASNKFYQLKGSKNDKINLLDHLDLLLPSPNFSKIGLFTFQNGIQNAFSDFEKMGNEILSNLREHGNPLCIGFYNTTHGVGYGIFDDLRRLNDQWGLNPRSVVLLRQLILTLSGLLPRNILWTHIAHSEGGLIANEVLTTKEYKLGHKQFDFIKRRLITLTYGAVAPVPDIVLEAINTYSIDDRTMIFAQKYLDKQPKPAFLDEQLKQLAQDYHNSRLDPKSKSAEQIYDKLNRNNDKKYFDITQHKNGYPSMKNGYTLKIVKSEVPKSEQPFIEKDHGFLKDTYKLALKNDIDYIIGTYKIL